MAKKDTSKSTSVMRKVDQLGRVVIPKELRKNFDIEDNKDLLEIYVEGDKIILKVYPRLHFLRQGGCTLRVL